MLKEYMKILKSEEYEPEEASQNAGDEYYEGYPDVAPPPGFKFPPDWYPPGYFFEAPPEWWAYYPWEGFGVDPDDSGEQPPPLSNPPNPTEGNEGDRLYPSARAEQSRAEQRIPKLFVMYPTDSGVVAHFANSQESYIHSMERAGLKEILSGTQ